MAIKLLAANIIKTDFYITLDADVILTRPFLAQDMIKFIEGLEIYQPFSYYLCIVT